MTAASEALGFGVTLHGSSELGRLLDDVVAARGLGRSAGAAAGPGGRDA